MQSLVVEEAKNRSVGWGLGQPCGVVWSGTHSSNDAAKIPCHSTRLSLLASLPWPRRFGCNQQAAKHVHSHSLAQVDLASKEPGDGAPTTDFAALLRAMPKNW